MNNEPVAWMDEINTFVLDKDYKQFPKSLQNGMIPLYTHPVKELDEQFKKGFEAGKEEGWKAHKFHHPVKELTAQEVMEQTHKKISEAHWKVKELTDEEIMEVFKGVNLFTTNMVDVARAILRKAQEK